MSLGCRAWYPITTTNVINIIVPSTWEHMFPCGNECSQCIPNCTICNMGTTCVTKALECVSHIWANSMFPCGSFHVPQHGNIHSMQESVSQCIPNCHIGATWAPCIYHVCMGVTNVHPKKFCAPQSPAPESFTPKLYSPRSSPRNLPHLEKLTFFYGNKRFNFTYNSTQAGLVARCLKK